MKNNSKYLILSSSYSVAVLMITGSVIQAFLLTNGAGEKSVTTYMSAVQIVQVASMLAFSAVIDRMKNLLKTYALVTLLQAALFAVLIFFCLFSGYPPTAIFITVFAVGMAVNVIQAMHSVMSYKAPYHIIQMRDYGTFTARSGIITGVLGTAVSAVMSYFTARYEYNRAMLAFFIAGALLLVLSSALILSVKSVPAAFTAKRQRAEKINIFKYRPFYIFIIPNVLRGFCFGILAVSMTVGHSVGLTDNSSGAVLTMLLHSATLTMVLAVICNLVCCIAYYTYLKRKKS